MENVRTDAISLEKSQDGMTNITVSDIWIERRERREYR